MNFTPGQSGGGAGGSGGSGGRPRPTFYPQMNVQWVAGPGIAPPFVPNGGAAAFQYDYQQPQNQQQPLNQQQSLNQPQNQHQPLNHQQQNPLNQQPPLSQPPPSLQPQQPPLPQANSSSRKKSKAVEIMSPASVHLGVSNGHHVGASSGHTTNEECGIREVWAHNMEEEFKTICQIVQRFNFVAMDTEFPGVVARPIGEFKSTADYQYQLLRCNVDLLKIIQLGLTFLDDKGNLPDSGPSTWQFNFKFNLTEDMYAEDSVDLLQNSGIQFEKHEQEGIDPIHFAEMMLTSGLVLMEPVKWLSFHSGYDFGYLLNLLTNQNLPKSEGEFFELLKLYFPNVYDVKYLMKSCKNLKGGLQEVANELEVPRIGPQHQAGSDSLLTGQTFFKMKEMFFEDDIDDSKYCGHLYGLGTNFVVGSNNKNNNSTTATTTTTTTTSTTTSSASATNTNTTASSSTAENGTSSATATAITPSSSTASMAGVISSATGSDAAAASGSTATTNNNTADASPDTEANKNNGTEENGVTLSSENIDTTNATTNVSSST